MHLRGRTGKAARILEKSGTNAPATAADLSAADLDAAANETK